MPKSTLFSSRIEKYAYYGAEETYREIGTSEDGLTDEQVKMMRQRYGVNSPIMKKKDTTIHRLRRAFVNPFNMILFVLGMISLVTDIFLASNFAKNATAAIIIFPMILIGGMIRLVQEPRAKNAAKQLDQLLHEGITVKREGELMGIPVEELVVGDIVLSSADDRVPADIRLTEVTDLFISRASIAGENAILEKNYRTHNHDSQITLTQLENLMFMATTVIGGEGEGIVLAVGEDTLYGNFAKSSSDDRSSFQNGAGSIVWVMLRFMTVLVPAVFVLLGITGGEWLESFAFALSVAVGLMPEMLPMIITTRLVKGSLTMSRKQTIIKDINTMQGLGGMGVLCIDKTGALTSESILLEYYMDVLGGENTEALDLAFLDSSYRSGVHSPIDDAILACQAMPGHETHYTNLLARYQEVGRIPFDYTRKLVSTLITGRNGESQLVMKGDISYIVAHCNHVEYRGEIPSIEKGRVQSVAAVVDGALQDGMEVIAVTQENMGYKKQIVPADETGMILMRYLTFFDAPEEAAKASVAALRKLKMAPKVLTRNQVDVAVSTYQRVGISSETMLTGARLDEVIDDRLSMAVEEIHVFAELTPG